MIPLPEDIVMMASMYGERPTIEVHSNKHLRSFSAMLASEIGRLKDPIDNHISDTVSYIA